jgi:hypothetical protein
LQPHLLLQLSIQDYVNVPGQESEVGLLSFCVEKKRKKKESKVGTPPLPQHHAVCATFAERLSYPKIPRAGLLMGLT